MDIRNKVDAVSDSARIELAPLNIRVMQCFGPKTKSARKAIEAKEI